MKLYDLSPPDMVLLLESVQRELHAAVVAKTGAARVPELSRWLASAESVREDGSRLWLPECSFC